MLLDVTINFFNRSGDILFNGFDFDIKEEDKKEKIPITFKHFLPSKWETNPMSSWQIDKRTLEKYNNESPCTTSEKCAALFAATPIQGFGLLLNLINRIVKLLTFSYLWYPSSNTYNFKARVLEMCKDFFRIIFTPVILIGLTLSALCGVICPLNGRKLYATFERSAYSGGYRGCLSRRFANETDLQRAFLGFCFQPEPKSHFFGGKIGEKDVW